MSPLISTLFPACPPASHRCRVKRVGPGALTVKRSGEEAESVLPFGTCVWATGVAMHPLVGGAGSRGGTGELSVFQRAGLGAPTSHLWASGPAPKARGLQGQLLAACCRSNCAIPFLCSMQTRGLKEQLQKQLIEVQNSRTGVVVDQYLRVKGTAGEAWWCRWLGGTQGIERLITGAVGSMGASPGLPQPPLLPTACFLVAPRRPTYRQALQQWAYSSPVITWAP